MNQSAGGEIVNFVVTVSCKRCGLGFHKSEGFVWLLFILFFSRDGCLQVDGTSG